MSKPVEIQFSKPWGSHNAGERAGFDAKQADHLVKCGVASYVDAVEAEAKANKAADDKQRAADKKAAPARQKAAEASAKKKAAAEKKAADQAAKEAADTE